jgi:hypothetical protein
MVSLLLLTLAQAPPPVTVRLRSGDQIKDAVVESIQADGTFAFKVGDAGTLEARLEELEAIELTRGGSADRGRDRLELVAATPLRQSGHMTGTLDEMSDGVLRFTADWGSVSVPRERVRRVVLGRARVGVAPGEGDGVATRETTVRGRLLSIDAEAVMLGASDGTTVGIPRSEAQVIEMEERPSPEEEARGLYLKAEFKSGTVLVTVPLGQKDGALVLFCPQVGEIKVAWDQLQRLSTIERLSFQSGRLISVDWRMLREGEWVSGSRQLRQVWVFTENRIRYDSSVKKLVDGGVLVLSAEDDGSLLELRPPAGSGGKPEIVFEASNLSDAIDACKLSGGRYFAAIRSSGKIAEVNAEGERVGEIEWPSGGKPLHIHATPPGNLMVLTDKRQIVELTPAGDEVRAVKFKGGRPERFEILEDGNFLLISAGEGKVWEVKPDGEVAWEIKNLSQPVGAARLDNGNTLVAEEGMRQIVEYDPRGRVVQRQQSPSQNGMRSFAFY